MDHFLYLIDLLTTVPALTKDVKTENGFVPLCAVRLNKIIFRYHYYLKYLIQRSIIECDGYYVPEKMSTNSNPKKCRGFKFTEKVFDQYPIS